MLGEATVIHGTIDMNQRSVASAETSARSLHTCARTPGSQTGRIKFLPLAVRFQ